MVNYGKANIIILTNLGSGGNGAQLPLYKSSSFYITKK